MFGFYTYKIFTLSIDGKIFKRVCKILCFKKVENFTNIFFVYKYFFCLVSSLRFELLTLSVKRLFLTIEALKVALMLIKILLSL